MQFKPLRIDHHGWQIVAVHRVRDDHVVQGPLDADRAGQTGAVAAFGQHEFRLLFVESAVIEQRRQRYAGVFTAGQHPVGVLDSRDGDVPPLHTAIRAALYEVDARHGRQAHQVVHRVDPGLADQTVHHQSMLARIDIVPALMVALEVQTVGRDDPEEPLQRRERHRRTSHASEPWALAALQIGFEFGGCSVDPRGDRLAERRGVRLRFQDGRVALGLTARRACGERRGGRE